MVLEAETDVGAQVKVGPQTTQAPDNLAGGPVDLVDGTGITGRDQIVALGIFVN